MPELPEVEITRLQIEPYLAGRRILRVATTAPSYFFITPPEEVRALLKGAYIASLERKGKYLMADLGDRGTLLLHLGMTGQLFTEGATSVRLLSKTAQAALSPENQRRFSGNDGHTHLRISFDDGGPRIFFRDVRKFGKVQLLRPGESCKRLESLGRDALELTEDYLHGITRKRKVPIKSFLLNQRLIAGVGNIYADEALFLSGIRPTRRAFRLTHADCRRLAKEVRAVMLRSIKAGGSSIRDYISPEGQDGGYQDERRVYARTGESCLVCKSSIKRVVVGQRSSHYCPKCQK